MPLETAATIDQLVATNPGHTDGLGQADSHLRLIKSCLQGSFPDLVGSTTVTATSLTALQSGTNKFADGSSGSPSIGYTADATAGFYRSSTGHQTIVGRLTGNGAVPVGSLHWFPIDPGSSLVARGGTATGAEAYIENDGSTYNNSAFPDLAAFLGQGGTTFTVPNLKDTGRYLRSRTATVTVGTYQAADTAPHSHGVGSLALDTQGAHTHTITITDPGHSHQYSDAGGGYSAAAGGNAQLAQGNYTQPQTGSATTGITAGSLSSGAHTHNVSGSTASYGGSETRPVSFVALSVIKT